MKKLSSIGVLLCITVFVGFSLLNCGGEELKNFYSIEKLGGWFEDCDRCTSINGIAVQGDYVFASDYYAGLQVFDVSDPASPQKVGQVEFEEGTDIAIVGDYAYVTSSGDNGLMAFDISDPANPSQVGATEDTNFDGLSIDINNNHAYIAGNYKGFFIVDISDPTNLKVINETDTDGTVKVVQFSDNKLYCVDYDEGLLVYDVSNPVTPNLLGSLAVENADVGAVRDTTVYFDWWDERGYKVIDASNPADLKVLKEVKPDYGNTFGLTYSGGYLFFACDFYGFYIVDVRNLEQIQEVKHIDEGDHNSQAVVIDGDTMYLADGRFGLKIYTLQW